MDVCWLLVMLGAVVAFSAVNWIYFKVLRLALLKNLVDNPDARKFQKNPVPVMGGVAVFFGVICGTLFIASLSRFGGGDLNPSWMPILTAMGLMLYVGVLDDMLGLTPRSRLVMEIWTVLGLIYSSGMCIDTFRGMWGVYDFSWYLAVPLTVFAGVGIINAVNMIDGVNGLSSGLCIICCTLFGLVFGQTEDFFNASLAWVMAGALVPFFIHNVFGLKSRMFIGDAGTMVMGILMTWFLMNLLSAQSPLSFFQHETRVNRIALGLAILSVPVFDALRVMCMRIVKGKSPFSPDKTHLHHAFVGVGISHFVTAMSEIWIGIVIFVAWGVSMLLQASPEFQLYWVMGWSACLVWGTYALLGYHASRQTAFFRWISSFSPSTHLGRTAWWKRFTAWLDAPGDDGSC